MPPKKEEAFALDLHPDLEKEYLERVERAKAACHGLQNGKQREAHLLKGIDEDISNQSRYVAICSDTCSRYVEVRTTTT